MEQATTEAATEQVGDIKYSVFTVSEGGDRDGSEVTDHGDGQDISEELLSDNRSVIGQDQSGKSVIDLIFLELNYLYGNWFAY